MGRYSGLLLGSQNIIQQLQQQQKMKQGLQTALLGEMLKPRKRTMEEELELERAKAGIKREAGLGKELTGWQEAAAKKGWGLQVEPGLPPEEQVRVARGLYAGRVGAEEKRPTKWQLQKEAADEAFRRLGGSYMVGLDEASRTKYENLANQLYQNLLTQYGYTEKPVSLPKAKSTTEQYEVGAIYENAQGNRMKYLGQGRWGKP